MGLTLPAGYARGQSDLRRMRHLPVVAVAMLVGLLSLVPLGFIIWIALDSGWETIASLVFRPRVAELLTNTLLLVAVVLLIAVVMSVVLAWLTERSSLPYARMWSWLMAAPLAVPAFVQGYAWNSLVPSFHGFWGAVLVAVLAYFPFLYLPIAAQLRRLDPTLEDTGAALGLPPVAVFFRIVVPQLRIAICGGALLVGLHLLAEYGLFVLMRFDTFSTAIMGQFQSVYNGPAANLLGGVLVLLCVLLLVIEGLARGQERYARVGPGVAHPPKKCKVPALVSVLPLLVAMLALGIPIYVLARWLILGGAGIWRLDAIGPALGQTLLLSLAGAALTTLAAFPAAWLSVRAPGRLQRIIEACHYYVGALPGVIVALALVTITVRIALPLYQTLATLLLLYVLLFLPRSLVGLRAGIVLAPVELEHAAMSLGKPPLVAMWSTTIRLAAPGVAASAALVALGIANELTGTLMLAPNGMRTLAMRFWAYSSELDFSSAAPYAVLMILLSAPLVALLRIEVDRMTRS